MAFGLRDFLEYLCCVALLPLSKRRRPLLVKAVNINPWILIDHGYIPDLSVMNAPFLLSSWVLINYGYFL
jgi:hypothetical protein